MSGKADILILSKLRQWFSMHSSQKFSTTTEPRGRTAKHSDPDLNVSIAQSDVRGQTASFFRHNDFLGLHPWMLFPCSSPHIFSRRSKQLVFFPLAVRLISFAPLRSLSATCSNVGGSNIHFAASNFPAQQLIFKLAVLSHQQICMFLRCLRLITAENQVLKHAAEYQ